MVPDLQALPGKPRTEGFVSVGIPQAMIQVGHLSKFKFSHSLIESFMDRFMTQKLTDLQAEF
jgi:Na+-transporting NADH:ubiquinone oxidoreductase subunit NqrC